MNNKGTKNLTLDSTTYSEKTPQNTKPPLPPPPAIPMNNNKQSMKLYTEEQVRELLKEIFKDDFFKGEDIIPIILGKELTPIELPSDEEMHPVKAVQEDGDWFLIPNELYQEFNEDTYNEELVDSGGFDDKWWKYKTGGDLNLIQLFAKIQGGNK